MATVTTRYKQLSFPWQNGEPSLPLSPGLTVPHFSTEFLDKILCGDPTSESAAFIRSIIDRDVDLIFIKDQLGRFSLVNLTVARIYGTTQEDLIGKRDADFNSNLEELERFTADDQYVLTSRVERVIPYEHVTGADGSRKTLRTLKVPIISGDGTATHVLGISTDITVAFELDLLKNRISAFSRRESPHKNINGSTNECLPTILLVDEDEAVREVTKDILEGAGYRVMVAKDGLQGLKQYADCRDEVRLLILDALIQKNDGEEMLKQVRRVDPRLPVIVCSGYAEIRTRETQGINSPAWERFLPKPYDPRQLLAYVKHLVPQ